MMKILKYEKKEVDGCEINYLQVQISDIEKHANELIKTITESSWIEKLDDYSKINYQNKVKQTSLALVEIFRNPIVNNNLAENFGEYVISLDAGKSLEEQLNHIIFPISELWKEKVLGNHGFDFHTETPAKLLNFGEAKYRSSGNAYSVAAEQINRFIAPDIRKDQGDINDLHSLGASKESLDNLVNDIRAFTLAYSVNSKDQDKIEKKVFENAEVKKLIEAKMPLFFIGVQIL